jgi:hypothetical protein
MTAMAILTRGHTFVFNFNVMCGHATLNLECKEFGPLECCTFDDGNGLRDMCTLE